MATDVIVLERQGLAALEKALEEARTVVLMRCKLVLDQGGSRQPQPDFSQRWWRASATPGVSVMLVVDEALPCAWLEVTDDDEARRRCTVGALRDHMPAIEPSDLAAQAAQPRPPKGALAALAISREAAFRSDLSEAVRRALKSDDESLKVEAAFAAATVKMSELRGDLERALDGEPQGRVRASIQRALEVVSSS